MESNWNTCRYAEGLLHYDDFILLPELHEYFSQLTVKCYLDPPLILSMKDDICLLCLNSPVDFVLE